MVTVNWHSQLTDDRLYGWFQTYHVALCGFAVAAERDTCGQQWPSDTAVEVRCGTIVVPNPRLAITATMIAHGCVPHRWVHTKYSDAQSLNAR